MAVVLKHVAALYRLGLARQESLPILSDAHLPTFVVWQWSMFVLLLIYR